MNHLRLLLGSLLIALLTACGGGGGDASPTVSGGSTATVAVTVIDTQGRFVAGASVTSASGTADTDAGGSASVPMAVGSEQLVVVSKAGFAEQVQPLTVPVGRNADSMRVMLIERDAAVAIAAIESGGSASGRDGVKVTFPAGALVDAAGNAVTGAIQMHMTPLDVTGLEAAAFPGAFEGVPSGAARTAIMSYGTAELLPLQNGQKLQLAAGKTAQIELPIYVDVHQDAAAVALGDTIALWSLDTATGVWAQDGSGTVVASAGSPTGKALRATVSHFSWWNGDVASQMATVNLTVHVPNPDAPVAVTTLAALSGQIVRGSGPGWLAQTRIAVEAPVAVSVPASATTRLAARVDLPTQVCAGTVDVSPNPGATVDATISAVCFTVPVPSIVEPATGKVTNSAGTLTVKTTLTAPVDAFDVLVDGVPDPAQHFDFSQVFYTTGWNLAPVAEGVHTLVARSARAGVTRDSAPVTVTIDRTPPQQTTVSPSASTEVDNGTAYDIDFSEAVFAGRPDLVLTDVVKLTVLPAGQSTAVEIPITASFDNGQTRVHVTANQSLPPGVVSLTWAGLRDGAGNTVIGQVAQSWNVARTTPLANLDGLFSNSTLVATTDSGGTVFTLHRRASDGNLVASRLAANGLVQLGPFVNDRAPGGDATGSIAVDGNGGVFVAFVQSNVAGTAGEVVVRRLDAGAAAWVTLPPAFALTVGKDQTILPHLQLNAAGQPVLVFSNLVSLRGFRFDGSGWVDLGTLAAPFITQLDMVLDNGGNPVVAHFDGSTLRAVRNTGTTWAPIGGTLDGVPNGTQGLGSLSAAVDGSGQPWLAWLHVGGPAPGVHLVRLNGAGFVDVPLPGTMPSGHPALTFVGADPVLVLGDDQSNVLRLQSGAWEAAVPVAVDGRGSVIARASNGALVLTVTGNGNGTGALLRVTFP